MKDARMRFGVALALLAWATTAGAQESALDALGRSTGLAAPEPDMPDFVKASRPAAPPKAVPAFAPPPEPKSKVKSADELKAMDADLERAAARSGGGPSGAAKRKTPRKAP